MRGTSFVEVRVTDRALEIERRFLVRRPDAAVLEQADARIEIVQGYLSTGGVSVRIRRCRAGAGWPPESGASPADSGHAWILTIKSGSGLVRREVELEVDAARGAELLDMCGPVRIEKTRHAIGRWEVDVLGGRFEGLVLAEVELESEDEPLPDPPAGLELGREVTEDPAITNHALAMMASPAARRFVQSLARH